MAESPQQSDRGGHSLPIRAAKTCERLTDGGLMQWAKKIYILKDHLLICRMKQLSETMKKRLTKVAEICKIETLKKV